MPETTENVKVNLDLIGELEAAQLAEALVKADAALKMLNATFEAGLAGQTAYAAQMQSLQTSASAIAASIASNVSNVVTSQQQSTQATQATTTATKQAIDDIYDFSDSYEVLARTASKSASTIESAASRIAGAMGSTNEEAEIGITVQGRQQSAVAKGAVVDKEAQKAKDAAAKSATMARMGAMQLAYVIQDATSVTGGWSQVLMAVSNNLQMMAIYSGMSTKAVLGMTVGVAALQMALRSLKLEDFKEFFTGVVATVDHSVDAMKKKLSELEAKKIKVGVDLQEIESLKTQIELIDKAISKYKELSEIRSTEAIESGEEVKKILEAETVVARPGQKPAFVSAGQVTADIKADFVKAFVDSDNEIMQIKERVAKREQEIAQHELDMANSRDQDERDQLARYIANAKEKKRIDNELAATRIKEISKPKGMAEQAYGELVRKAEETGGVGQQTAIEQIQKLLKGRGYQFAAEQLGQATPEAIREKNQQRAKFQREEQMRKLDADLIQKGIDAKMKDVKEVQLSEGEMSALGKKAREKFADNIFKQYDYVAAEVQSRLEKGMSEAKIGVVPPEARERIKQQIVKDTATAATQIMAGARKAEQDERDRKGDVEQKGIDRFEDAQAQARRNIQEKLGQENIARTRGRLAQIDMDESKTEGQKRTARAEEAARIRAIAHKAFMDAGMTASQIADAMKQLIPELLKDFENQVNRMRTIILTERKAQEMAHRARPFEVPAPEPINRRGLEEEARRRVMMGAPGGNVAEAPIGPMLPGEQPLMPVGLEPQAGGMRSISPGPGPGLPPAPAPMAAQAAAPAAMPPVGPLADVVGQTQGTMGQTQQAMLSMASQIANLAQNQRMLASQAGMVNRAVSENQITALPLGSATC